MFVRVITSCIRIFIVRFVFSVLIYQVEAKDSKSKDTRGEASAALNNKDPGTFYIRSSSSVANSLVLQFVKLVLVLFRQNQFIQSLSFI